MNQNFIALAIQGVMPAALATGLFVSLFTAQQPVPNIGETGALGDGPTDYVDVVGLVAIPCTAPPISTDAIQATEVRALEEITAAELHHVLLNGYYPALDLGWRGDQPNSTGAWIARIAWGDQMFNYTISGVESDSQSQMTRVKVKLATN